MAKATARNVQAVAKCRDLVEGLMGEFLQVGNSVILHLIGTDAFQMFWHRMCVLAVSNQGLCWCAHTAEVS